MSAYKSGYLKIKKEDGTTDVLLPKTLREQLTSNTAAGTANKTVDFSGFALITGAEINVKFTNTNTAVNPTLNVNSTGAKDIRFESNTIVPGCIKAGVTYTFIYDGTYWSIVNPSDVIITATLTTSNWDLLAKTQTITVNGLTASANGSVGLADDVTDEQYDAACVAKLRKSAQSEDSLTIKCREIPIVDIPIKIVVEY